MDIIWRNQDVVSGTSKILHLTIFVLEYIISNNIDFRLELSYTGRYVTAQITHYEAGPVVQASTSEWAIKKQLFKTNDTAAYVNLARVSLTSHIH